MSREIEFRAWDKKSKMFIGNDLLFVLANNTEYSTSDRTVSIKNGLQNPYMKTDKNNNLEMDLIWEQYTGLKDKNGVKIFEGDILEAVVNNSIDLRLKGEPKCIAHWTVEYKCFQNNIGFMVYGKDRRWNKLLMRNMIYNCKVQVIGNIYENPELLSKEQNNEGKKQDNTGKKEV